MNTIKKHLVTLVCVGSLLIQACNKDDGAVAPTQQNIVPANPAAYFPFSGNANDASGHGYTGTIDGATLTSDRFGNANTAYNFTTPSRIIYGDILGSVFTTNAYTISIWYKPAANATNGGLLSKWNNVYSTTGNAFWFTPEGFTSNTKGTNLPAMQKGVWTHDVVTMNSGVMTLYRNSVQLAQDSGHQSVSSTGYPFAVGGNVDGNSPQYQFLGVIDDIRIYDRVLTATDALNLYHEGGY